MGKKPWCISRPQAVSSQQMHDRPCSSRDLGPAARGCRPRRGRLCLLLPVICEPHVYCSPRRPGAEVWGLRRGGVFAVHRGLAIDGPLLRRGLRASGHHLGGCTAQPCARFLPTVEDGAQNPSILALSGRTEAPSPFTFLFPLPLQLQPRSQSSTVHVP